MKNVNWPTLSIIIVVKNAEATIDKCLEYISLQDYPKSQTEVILVDGGSTDRTKTIAKKYDVMFIDGGYPDNQEARRYVGYKRSKGDILVFIDSDNYVKVSGWLKKMVLPIVDGNASCSFTKWYGYDKTLNLVDRYFSLIGGNDPVAYYLEKNDRVEYQDNLLPKGAILCKSDKNAEYVKFDIEKLPVIGCNGFLIKKSILDSIDLISPEYFYHIDVHLDIIKANPEIKYAIVKENIYHAGNLNFMGNIKKRLKYKTIHMNQLCTFRRYKVFDIKSKRDIFNLIKLIIYIIAIFPLILRALIGIYKTKKVEWLMHPFVVIGMSMAYAINIMRKN